MKLILLIILVLIISFILFFWFEYPKKIKLESFSDYQQCRSKGYTKEFCQLNPNPDVCQCANGSIGRLVPGFKGKCLCFNTNVNQITQDVDQYTSNLLSGELGTLPGIIQNNSNLSKYIQKESLLSYFYPQRSRLKNVENIIPYHPLDKGSFY